MGVHTLRSHARGAGVAAVRAARAVAGRASVLAAVVLAAALLALPNHAAARSARLAPSAAPSGTAAASASTDLYVNNQVSCSDSGNGTLAQPFCDVAAAAAFAQPGDTVFVEPGGYPGVTISVSGTSAEPITFVAVNTFQEEVGLQGGLVVLGAQDVVISGFNVGGVGQPFLVDNSSNVTITGGSAVGTSATLPAVQVTGTSSNVMIDGVAITGQGTDVEIDPGVTGAVVTTNTIIADPGPAVLVSDAPGTDVVSNTVSYCNTGVEVTGGSTGSYLENNIAEWDAALPTNTTGCTYAKSAAFSVSADSTPQTVANYNLIDPASNGLATVPLYNWGGTSYTSLAAFNAATGQGTDDIAANPELNSETGTPVFFFSPGSFSPAINSANAEAPGEQPVDQLGNPRSDDPDVPKTGTGPGYYDRGAVQEEVASYGDLTVEPDPADGPLAVTASAPITTPWTTNGPLGTDEYIFSSSALPVMTSGASSASYVFPDAGPHFVQVDQNAEGLSGVEEQQTTLVTVGADYTPVSPERILDTRIGLGAAKAPVAAHGDLTLPIPAIDGVNAADMSGVAVNVTVTGATAGGDLTVFTQSGAGDDTSNINFAAGQTIANLVTVQPAGGAITFYNNSGGTVQVIADLDGYYGNSGSGFQGVGPVRVLDTRNGTGTAGPVAAHGTVRLNLSGELPAGAAAAVLNLTVTQPKDGGNIRAFADGQPVPGTSNLNFTAGETIPNQVIVPLAGDVADFYNDSSGTVQLVADLDGYYASGAIGSFVPVGPTRVVDTRSGLGIPAGAVPAHGTLVVSLPAGTPSPSAWVLNVTVTEPQAGGDLRVFPENSAVPDSSSLNFSAAQTIANLVTVEPSSGEIAIYNDSSGSVQIVIDEQGYFFSQQ
jgi:hypothetical protein